MAASNAPEYEMEFSPRDWVEIAALSFEPFDISEQGQPLTRGQWLAVAKMCYGKAHLCDAGYYGEEDSDEGFYPKAWSDQLRFIADRITKVFQPGDGKL